MRAQTCQPCRCKDHEGCWQILSPAACDQCDCYDADPDRHETKRAHYRAMGIEDEGDGW